MDLRALRDEVLAATSRHFWDKLGFVPAEDSEEWEEEYRRQFTLAKARHAGQSAPAAKPAAAEAGPRAAVANLPELNGSPTEMRWAQTVRDDRLQEITDGPTRLWLARTWTRAKAWIDTRELSPEVFRARATVWYADYQRTAAEEAKVKAVQRQSETAAAGAIHDAVAKAGLTAEGLLELVDLSARTEPTPLTTKLAEFTAEGRHLRIYETADAAILLVKEKSGAERSEYGIESDAGLVADLRLFAQDPVPAPLRAGPGSPRRP